MDNKLSFDSDAFYAALKRKGWTMRKLADEFNNKYLDGNADKYNTIRGWNSGKSVPRLDDFIKMCDLLDVDVDFLLGRMDEYNHAEKVIHESTGLSYDAIEKTLKLNKRNIQSLNLLLEDNNFEWVLFNIANYQKAIKEYQESLYEKQKDVFKMASEISGEKKSTPESREQRKQIDDRLNEADFQWDAMAYRIDTEFRKVIDDIKNKTS